MVTNHTRDHYNFTHMENDQRVQGSHLVSGAKLPRREGWNVDDAMGDDHSYSDAAKFVMRLWNEWADKVVRIFRV